MWKLMRNIFNLVFGWILPMICVIVMVAGRDQIMGIIGVTSILLCIAWGNKVPSVVVASDEQFEEFRKRTGLSLSEIQPTVESEVDNIMEEAIKKSKGHDSMIA